MPHGDTGCFEPLAQAQVDDNVFDPNVALCAGIYPTMGLKKPAPPEIGVRDRYQREKLGL
jgi:hypothetical protein